MSLGKWRTFNLHKDVDWITSPWNPSHIGGPTLLWLCLETRSTRVKVKLGHKRWNPNPGGLQSHGQGARPLRKPPLPNFDLGLSVPKLWGHGFLGWGSQSLIFGDGGPSQVNSRESDRFEGLQRTRQVSFSHSFMTHYSVCMRSVCVHACICECVKHKEHLDLMKERVTYLFMNSSTYYTSLDQEREKQGCSIKDERSGLIDSNTLSA